MQKTKYLWWLWGITSLLYLLLLLVTTPQLKALSGGMEILDTLPYYEPPYVQLLLEKLGQQGRDFYLYRQIPIDLVYPALFGITYFCIIRFFINKLNLKKIAFLSILPIIGAMFDYAENISIINLLSTFPTLSETTTSILPIFSLLKTIFVSVSLLAFATLGIYCWLKCRTDPL